jgi:hypothetical protein
MSRIKASGQKFLASGNAPGIRASQNPPGISPPKKRGGQNADRRYFLIHAFRRATEASGVRLPALYRGDFAPRGRASGPGQGPSGHPDPAGFRPRSSGPRPAREEGTGTPHDAVGAATYFLRRQIAAAEHQVASFPSPQDISLPSLGNGPSGPPEPNFILVVCVFPKISLYVITPTTK